MSSAFLDVKINTSEELDFCMRKNSKLHIWSYPIDDMYTKFKIYFIKFSNTNSIKHC